MLKSDLLIWTVFDTHHKVFWEELKSIWF